MNVSLFMFVYTGLRCVNVPISSSIRCVGRKVYENLKKTHNLTTYNPNFKTTLKTILTNPICRTSPTSLNFLLFPPLDFSKYSIFVTCKAELRIACLFPTWQDLIRDITLLTLVWVSRQWCPEDGPDTYFYRNNTDVYVSVMWDRRSGRVQV